MACPTADGCSGSSPGPFVPLSACLAPGRGRGDVRTRGRRAISDVRGRSLGSADCRSGIEIRCGLRVYSGQCPRAWHEDPAANDDGRPSALVASVPVRAQPSGEGVRALGADRPNDLIRPSGADEVDRPPVTEKRVKAPQPRTSGIGLVHADQVRPDAPEETSFRAASGHLDLSGIVKVWLLRPAAGSHR